MSIPSNGWLPGRADAQASAVTTSLNAQNGESHQASTDDDPSFFDFLFGEDGADVYDVLDVINPLQHIPLVNTFYREITGDEIGHGARLAGGTLYAGPIGLAGAAFNAAVDAVSGRDIGEHTVAMFQGDEAEPAAAPLLASWFRSDDAPAPSEPAGAPPVQLAALPAQEAVSDAPASIPAAAEDVDYTAPRPTHVADGMAHFSAFAPNGQLMSPAELAAQLNQQRAVQHQQAVERAETYDAPDGEPELAETTPVLSPATASADQDLAAPVAQPAFPHDGQPPQLGGWFDTAVIQALQKYEALKQDQTAL